MTISYYKYLIAEDYYTVYLINKTHKFILVFKNTFRNGKHLEDYLLETRKNTSRNGKHLQDYLLETRNYILRE